MDTKVFLVATTGQLSILTGIPANTWHTWFTRRYETTTTKHLLKAALALDMTVDEVLQHIELRHSLLKKIESLVLQSEKTKEAQPVTY